MTFFVFFFIFHSTNKYLRIKALVILYIVRGPVGDQHCVCVCVCVRVYPFVCMDYPRQTYTCIYIYVYIRLGKSESDRLVGSAAVGRC